MFHNSKKNSQKNQKFGCIRYSSTNIGDEIQSVAACRFLPQIDYYVPRERMDKFHSENSEKVKVIMNAWWMWQPNHFPPSADIDPLFISFHLREGIRNEKFMTNKTIEYLKAHAPIGCRDTATEKFFKENGIDSYFSGCLTLTLLPNENIKKKAGDYILCVDVPPDVEKTVRERAEKPVYTISRMLMPAFTSIERLEVAKVMLYAYHNAACIITPRLHVGLPGIAFRTPVCMLTTDSREDEVLTRRGRFDGLENVFNEVDVEEFLRAPVYDINNPPENPENHIALRDALVEKCTAFTGYDSHEPVFGDDYNPLLTLLGMLDYSDEKLERSIYYAKSRQIISVLYDKVNNKKSRHDLTY
jgi:hypothetical protein